MGTYLEDRVRGPGQATNTTAVPLQGKSCTCVELSYYTAVTHDVLLVQSVILVQESSTSAFGNKHHRSPQLRTRRAVESGQDDPQKQNFKNFKIFPMWRVACSARQSRTQTGR